MHEHNKTLVMRAAYGKLTGFILGLLGMVLDGAICGLIISLVVHRMVKE
jgi:hypothetical protein